MEQRVSCAQAPPADSGVYWLQGISIGWMLIECAVSLLSAWRSHSLVLAAFGGDSFVELLSAGIALCTLSPTSRLSKKGAERAAGVLLYALALIVALTAMAKLFIGATSESSLFGIIVTAAALLIMPVLALLKRRAARRANNMALSADAVQSATCAYLSAITLASLAIVALFHWPWVDVAGSLVALPVLLIEARRTIRGQGCCCC